MFFVFVIEVPTVCPLTQNKSTQKPQPWGQDGDKSISHWDYFFQLSRQKSGDRKDEYYWESTN